MSDPNSDGDKAGASDKTAVISGAVGGGGTAAGQVSGQVGGRGAPADRTMIVGGGAPPAKVEVDGAMLQPQAPQKAPPNNATIVARGTKPS